MSSRDRVRAAWIGDVAYRPEGWEWSKFDQDTELLVDATAFRSWPVPPARGSLRWVIFLLTTDWLGAGPDPVLAARSAAAVGLTHSLAALWAGIGTTVNAIAVPRRSNLVTSADVAHALRYFADPLNGYVTGQVLNICGGQTLVAALTA